MNEVHFYCVIDFEGTCEEENPKDYIHEIIEFPAVLVDANTLEVVSIVMQCSSRKYPYSPTVGFPPPSPPPPHGNSSLASYFASKFLTFKTPLPLEILDD